MIFFSIVIPVYNREKMIAETLTHVFKQDFHAYEVIVVDDGSTDGTNALLVELCRSHGKMKLITISNSERGAARNTGYRNSQGDYVVFLDSDDIMHRGHLRHLDEEIVKNNFPPLIASKFDFVSEDDKHFSSDVSKIAPGYYDYRLFLNGNPLACNFCVKRSLEDLILFNEDRELSIKEDWIFLLQNTITRKLLLTDTVTISMRDHAGRSMRKDNQLVIERTLKATRWILKNIPLSKEEQNSLEGHCNYLCSIHSYLENERKAGFKFLQKAIRAKGLRIKFIALYLKLLIGRNAISRIK